MIDLFSANSLRIIATFFIAVSIQAADWPQWRGPQRNGSSTETGLLKQWPKEGPKLLWMSTNIGSGYSSPAVVRDRLYLLSNDGEEAEFVQAHSIQDGKLLWRTRLGKVGPNNPQMNYPGARSTPTVDGELLYALGSDGDIACVETDSGKIRWQKNLRTDFGGKAGDWAYSESPLIDGDNVICTPGGTNATVLALRKGSGEVLWLCATPEGDRAAYASPIVVEVGGIRQYVQLLEKGLIGVEAKTGKLLWRYSKAVSRFNANIPSPVAGNDMIYVGSAGTGAGAVKLAIRNGSVEIAEAYFEAKLPMAIGGTVKFGPHLYGTTGQALLCVDFATGKVLWEERSIGAASICLAEGHLYMHGENGEVALVEALPSGYREKGRFTPPGQVPHSKPMEKDWAYPALADRRLYIRDRESLWCYDLNALPAARLLIDQSHGQSGIHAAYLEMAAKHGAEVITNANNLTPETLRNVSALAIFMPQEPFDDSTIAAVIDLVKRGGSLLLTVDATNRHRTAWPKLRVNDLIAPFGLRLTDDTPYLHNRGAMARSSEINPSTRELPYSGGRAIEGGTPMSHLLDSEGQSTALAHAAYVKVPGGGKVLVLAETMVAYFISSPDGVRLTGTTPSDTRYWGKDARLFMEEVVAWLLAR